MFRSHNDDVFKPPVSSESGEKQGKFSMFVSYSFLLWLLWLMLLRKCFNAHQLLSIIAQHVGTGGRLPQKSLGQPCVAVKTVDSSVFFLFDLCLPMRAAFCENKFVCASLKIFISASVSLQAATSALSSAYPGIILQDTIIMSRPLVWLHTLSAPLKSSEDEEGGKVDFLARKTYQIGFYSVSSHTQTAVLLFSFLSLFRPFSSLFYTILICTPSYILLFFYLFSPPFAAFLIFLSACFLL